MVVPLNFGRGRWGVRREEEVGWWDRPIISHQTDSHSYHQLAVNSPYHWAWHILSAQLRVTYWVRIPFITHPDGLV